MTAKKSKLLIEDYSDYIRQEEGLEKFIETSNTSNRARVKERAIADGRNGIPRKGEPLSAYKFAIESDYLPVYENVRTKLQVKEKEALTALDLEQVESRKIENEKEENKKQHEYNTVNIEHNRLADPLINKGQVYLVYVVLFIVMLFNGLVDAQAISDGLGLPLVISAIWGFLIACSISILSKITPFLGQEYLSKRWQKVAFHVGSILVVGIVCYIIGTFRTNGVDTGLDIEDPALTSGGTSPFVFSFLNSFIYTIELGLCLAFLPTKTESKKVLQREKYKAEMERLNKELETIKQENKELEEEMITVRKIRKAVEIYQHFLHDLIKSQSVAAYGFYLSENALHRNDGYQPQDEFPALFNQKNELL